MKNKYIQDHLDWPRFVDKPTVIYEPYGYRVVLDLDGSSRNAVNAIWRGQHQCVIEGFAPDDPVPDNKSDIIIKHQLSSKRGHFSVTDQAFVVMAIEGAPHESIAQLTRHSESTFLVQSGRYSGKRYQDVAHGRLDVEKVFFMYPCGFYRDREGNKFEITEVDRADYFDMCLAACVKYAYLVEHQGYSYEVARSYIPYNFRQNFQVSARLRDWWHLLDQRSKYDAQLSTRVLAVMFHEMLKRYICRDLQEWYEDNRLGKAQLAP